MTDAGRGERICESVRAVVELREGEADVATEVAVHRRHLLRSAPSLLVQHVSEREPVQDIHDRSLAQ